MCNRRFRVDFVSFFLIFNFLSLSPCLGQTRVSSGHFPSADGAVSGPARPCREDSLPTEASAGGRGAHQSGHLTGVHGEDIIPHLNQIPLKINVLLK